MQKSALNRYFNICTIFTTFNKPICDSMQCLGSGSGPTQIQIRNKYRQELKNRCPSQKAWGEGRGEGGEAVPFVFLNSIWLKMIGVGGHSFHQLTLHINSVNT